VAQLGRREIIGLGSLTRQAVAASVTADTDLNVLLVPNAILDRFVKSNPELARDIGTEIDNRRVKARVRLTEYGLEPDPGGTLTA
jgi:CRP-like cAMP-binding protein